MTLRCQTISQRPLKGMPVACSLPRKPAEVEPVKSCWPAGRRALPAQPLAWTPDPE